MKTAALSCGISLILGSLAFTYTYKNYLKSIEEADSEITKDPSYDFKDLVKLFPNERRAHNSPRRKTSRKKNVLAGFTQAVSGKIRNKPSSKDMMEMVNNLHRGRIPNYVNYNGFTKYSNKSGNYHFSNGNDGAYSGTNFGLFKSDGVFNSLSFDFYEGGVPNFKYFIGNCKFSEVRYSIKDESVTWQGYTQSKLFFLGGESKLYEPFGEYFGRTKGKATFNGTLQQSLSTVGILNLTYYVATTLTNGIGYSTDSQNIIDFDMISLTGGTNATISINTNIPRKGNIVNSNMSGKVQHDRVSVSINSTSSGHILRDHQNPFGEANLQNIFVTMYSAIGVFIS